MPVSLKTLLTFILHLFHLRLSHSALNVYISAVVDHQPSHSDSVRLFFHPTLKKFLKGLQNIHTPPQQHPLPQWSLQLVLNVLTRPPFEPMATSNFKLLSLKTSFLVAVTSAKCAALRSDPPFPKFHPDKVTLYLMYHFYPKLSLNFISINHWFYQLYFHLLLHLSRACSTCLM